MRPGQHDGIGAAAMSLDPQASARPIKALPARSARGSALLRRLPCEVRLFILAAIYLGPPTLLALSAAFVYYTVQIPDPMALPNKAHARVVRLLARDQSLLSERGAAEANVPVDLLPQHLLDAIVATEDRRFFKHWGLDTGGMLRAAFANLRAGR